MTETWLNDGPGLEQDLRDLEHGANLQFLCKNRPSNQLGQAHGGVAIVSNKSRVSLSVIERPNPENYEVLVATGKIFGLSRKLVVTGAYVPPGYSVARGRGAIDYIKEYILEVKRKYRDPYLVIVGDFNQWKAEDATVDYLDIREADEGRKLYRQNLHES